MSQLLGVLISIPSPLPTGQPGGGHALEVASFTRDFTARFGYIAGVVTINGTPCARRVFLSQRDNQRLAASAVSDAAGAYRFDHLDAQRRYTVHALDYTDTYNAVIADNLSPVAY